MEKQLHSASSGATRRAPAATPAPDSLRAAALRSRREFQNQAMLRALMRAFEATKTLIEEGHTVVGVDISTLRPTVQLQAGPRLAAMADEQHGAYFMRGVDTAGQHYRKGMLLNWQDVNVVWFERGQ
jgi:hypothetical protein